MGYFLRLLFTFFVFFSFIFGDLEQRLQEQEQANKLRTQRAQDLSPNLSKDQDLGLLKAINTKNINIIKKALKIYKTSAFAKKEMIIFAKANIAYLKGDISMAIDLYEELLRGNFHLRAKLDLARLYFLDNQNKEAKELFSSLFLPQINQKVALFLRRINDRASIHGYFAIGLDYTKNLNQSPQKTTTFVTPTQIYTRKSPKSIDTGSYSFEASLNKLFFIKSNHNMIFKSLCYGSFYNKHGSYNEATCNAIFGYKYKNHLLDIHLAPIIEATYIDDKIGATRAGGVIRFFKQAKKYFISFGADLKDESYKDKWRYNDGRLFFANLSGLYAFSDEFFILSNMTYTQKTQMASKENEYDKKAIRLGFIKRINLFEIRTNISFAKSTYAKFSPTLNAKREDNEQTYNIDLKLSSHTNISPTLSYTHTKNTSNVDWLYSYNKDRLSLKLETSW